MSRPSKKAPIDEEDEFFKELIETEGSVPKAGKTKGGWPVNVPILTPGDLVWNFSTRLGRHDLAVWLELTFNPENPMREPKAYRKAYRTLCHVITERFGKKVSVLPLFLEFTVKHRLPCLAWQASCWNEMLSRLGYEVPKKSTKDPGFKPQE